MGDGTHNPAEMPTIQDEAPPTPAWVPILGLALLAMIALVSIYRAATAPEEPAVPVPAAAVAPTVEVEGAAAPAPAAPAPAAVPTAPPAPGGEADSFGRQQGDEHFGHGHP